MRGFLIIFGLLAALWSSPTQAQNVNLNCFTGTAAPQWVPCPGNLPTTNSSAVIATGNTFQTILAADSTAPSSIRKSLTIQNNNSSGTDNCWIFIGSGSATKATSIVLSVGQSYTRYFPNVPSDAIQGTCATTSDTIYIDVQ